MMPMDGPVYHSCTYSKDVIKYSFWSIEKEKVLI